jgi:hypothetical protein
MIYPHLEGCVKIYIIITRCDTPPNYLLKQRGNCGSPNVAEVMMLKNDNCGGIGIHGGLVQMIGWE